MKASSVRANADVRSASADKAGKKGGQTKARTHGQPSPFISPALKAGWPGGGTEGMAGELASMPPIQRQLAVNSLQSTRGNSFVQRLAIQAKLKVGPAGDKFEMQADQVADQVMGMTEPANSVQRQEGGTAANPLASSITPLLQRVTSFITLPLQRQGEEEEIQTKPLVQRQGEEEEIQTKPLVQRQGEEEEIQTKSTSASGGFEAGSAFERRLSATRGGGRSLPGNLRGQMEAGFGADFSGVRVHTGGEAAQLNRAVSAQAFTHGQDIYLGEGKGDLESSAGRKLLAHELTHTIQQTGAVRRQTPGPVESVSRAPQGIQRLMSKDELMAKAGKPKRDILFHKMSTHYKKVLSAVGEYDSYLSVQPVVRSQNGNIFAKAGKEILDTIKAAAMEYLLKHNTGKRRAVIFDLVKQIDPERKALDNAAANYDLIKNLPGRTALWYAKSLPSAPAPTPPKPSTPSVPKHAPPSKPLPPTPATPPTATPPVTTESPTPATPPTTKPRIATEPPTSTAIPTKPEEASSLTEQLHWWSDAAQIMARDVMNKDLPTFKRDLPPGFERLDPIDYIAIKMYTMADYLYINPVLEKNPGWLTGITGKPEFGKWLGLNKQRIVDGLLNDPAGLLRSMDPEVQLILMAVKKALNKLKPYTGGFVYRGEPRTEQAYKETYKPPKPGTRIEKPYFWSSTANESVAENFIDMNMEAGKLPVKLRIRDPKGFDIDAISNSPGEAEVLIPPPSEFEVVSAHQPGDLGPDDGYQNVVVKQTKSGME